jgi:DNA-binding CsgD family transcriptional regulator/tetratricopeptide (TPR) repeat protein
VELLEREALLGELHRHWKRAASGRGGLVWIAGEAGSGKTVLVHYLIETMGKGIRAFIGACDPLTTPRALGPLLDIAATPGSGLEGLVTKSIAPGAMLPRLLDRLRNASAPTLLVIEDVHWADGATLDLLRYLGRRVENAPGLLLVTYRDDEVGARHPLRVILGDLATSKNVHRLTLPPLSEAAVRRLAEGSSLDARALHQRTGGNPFFVTQVLAAGGTSIPPTVRDAILARAARLGSEARDALEAMAVMGPQVDPALLAEVAGAAVQVIDEAVGLGLLEERGSRLAFRHELVRDALLETVSDRHKKAWHGAILKALETGDASGTDAAVLAHHAEAAGDIEAVLRHAPVAAQRAIKLRSHREAAAQLARALRYSDRLTPLEHARLLESYAQECQLLDRLDDAAGAFEAAIRIRRDLGDRAGVAENLARTSSVLVRAGRNADAEAAIQAALDLVDGAEPGPLLAFVCQRKASLLMLDRDTAAAVRWAERALEVAAKVGDVQSRIAALNALGSALLVEGDERGEAHLKQSLDLAMQSGLDERAASAYGNLGSGLGEFFRFGSADRYLVAGIAFARERDQDGQRHYMEAWQALSHLYQGRWQEAATTALGVPGHAATVARIMALVALGRVRARRGDPEAWAVLDEALGLADITGTLQRLAPVRAARAEAAWLGGEPSRAFDEASAAFELAERRRHPWFAGELAYWRWKAGGGREAPEFSARPFALQIAGSWKEAAAVWRELNCPYETARALAEGDDPRALREALGVFDALGARPAATETARRLRESGERGIRRGPRRTTRSNPAGLTDRELDVLRLVCEGMSNPAIAERLGVSPRTVDHHVSSVLAKLEVRSRAQAIGLATRLGIHPQDR